MKQILGTIIASTRAIAVLGLALAGSVSAAGARFDEATYAYHLYGDILHREASAGEVNDAVTALKGGSSPKDVALSLLQSLERKELEIERFINGYLRRPANPADYHDGIELLNSGAQPADIIAIILSSPEYSYLHGNSARGLCSGFYGDLLGRAPSWDEFRDFLSRLRYQPARELALWLLNGAEFRERLVRGFYRAYLRREADAPGLAAWTQALNGGMPWEQVQAGFLSSDEYLKTAGIHHRR